MDDLATKRLIETDTRQENYIRHVEARLRQLEADVTGTGLSFTGFWVNDLGELMLTYSGIFPALSIDPDGNLILTYSGPEPALSIDPTGSLNLEF